VVECRHATQIESRDLRSSIFTLGDRSPGQHCFLQSR
jgi:hypothetical protein